MSKPKYPFKESNKVSGDLYNTFAAMPIKLLKKLVSQYRMAGETNCPWYVYHSRGLADLIAEIIKDLEFRSPQFKKGSGK